MERVLQRLPCRVPGTRARQPATLRGLRVASRPAPRALPAAIRNVSRLRAASLPRTGAASTAGAATPVLWPALFAARKGPAPSEKETEALLRDLARINGWQDDNLSFREQRILYDTTLRGTKYEGTLPSKGQASDGSTPVKLNGRPDAVLFAAGKDFVNRDLLAIVELKREPSKLDEALGDLDVYCRGLLEKNSDLQRVLGIAMAGNKYDGRKITVVKYVSTGTAETFKMTRTEELKKCVDFPTPEQVEELLKDKQNQESQQQDVKYGQHQAPDALLDGYAKKFNELFRKAHVKDEKRPAVVGALMLALWYAQKHSREIRRTDPEIITDVQNYCEQAFAKAGPRQAAMGKVLSSVLDSLMTEQQPGDVALASAQAVDESISVVDAVRTILFDLETLNVGKAQLSSDFLGQLYERFFTYTGGNTIGQYFTPRWVTALMAKMAHVKLEDKVLDPCSGTGGFLIAAAQEALQNAQEKSKWEDAIDKMKDNLYGFESESVTAALCVVNMIIRGDGKSNVYSGDCFKAPEFPTSNKCVDKVLMNPPFGTDTPVHMFLDRGLEGLRDGGLLLAVVPDSVLFDKKSADWREALLQKHTLKALIQLPQLTFQPMAKVDTHIIMLQKGVPHAGKPTAFYRMKDGAGLELSKKVIRPVSKDSNTEVIEAVVDFVDETTNPEDDRGDVHSRKDCNVWEQCTAVKVEPDSPDWSVGQHLPWHYPAEAELLKTANRVMLSWASANLAHTGDIVEQRAKLAAEGLSGNAVASRQRVHTFDALATKNPLAREYLDTAADGTLGKAYLTTIGGCGGMKRLKPGSQLLISAGTSRNGVKGAYELSDVLHPPFITVTHKGGPGKAFVHTEPAAVLDTCLVLMPPADARPLEERLADMFLHAALISLNSWRFTYARTCTRERIGDLELHKARISHVNRAKLVAKISSLLSMLEDMHDSPLCAAQLQ